MALRLIFCGTPQFAVPTLQRLNAEPDFRIVAVVTQPDRPRGRGLGTACSAVKTMAQAARLPVYQPGKLNTEESFQFFQQAEPDAVVIIAFGQIIRPRFLAIPRHGWINLHASLLPQYRGAAPIQWSIARGEVQTGLTTMQIDAGMDTGPILLAWKTEIGPDETAPELAERMAAAGPDLMVDTLRGLEGGGVGPRPQDNSLATMAPILKREDGRIDWNKPAQTIYNRIRGLAPWPGAFTGFRGEQCHIWGRPASDTAKFGTAAQGGVRVASGEMYVACGESTWLHVEEVQREGRKRMTAREFLAGARLTAEDHFAAISPAIDEGRGER